MVFEARYYQREAFDAITSCTKKRRMIVLPTGAGKAILCAMLAEWSVNLHAGQKVLMLVPTQELVLQNREKLEAIGYAASTWCASLGPKQMRRDIVIGTPQSVYRNIHMFTKGQFAAVLIDECQDMHPTNQTIVTEMEAANPDFFSLGLTATPWRTGEGWIYAEHVDYGVTPADQANEPFFEKCCYESKAATLIAEGYLSGPAPTTQQQDSYSDEGLVLSNGKYTNASLDKVIGGQSVKTQRIVADVVRNSEDCKSVIIFAASRSHARQICDCLPPGEWAYIDGSMSSAERKRAIKEFKSFEKKYIVNIGVLTTGFDHPALDHVVIMRPMESSLLWTQCAGRGCRVYEGKETFKISDYGGNVDEFFPDGDIFNPVMRVAFRGTPLSRIDATCPDCGHVNDVALFRQNEDKEVDSNGWLIDLMGQPVVSNRPYLNAKGETVDEWRKEAAHMGQRCCGVSIVEGKRVQCSFMWNFKRCHCGHQNSLSAKVCAGCGEVIHDVNKKLKAERAKIRAVKAATREEQDRVRAELQAIASADPFEYRRAPVEHVTVERYMTRKHETILRALVKLPRPLGTVEVYLLKNSHQRKLFCDAVFGCYVEKDNDLLKKFNTDVAWLKPREVTHVEFKEPRSKKGAPHIRAYEVA